MIVFEWFYENNEFFEQLLQVENGYEVINYSCFVTVWSGC